MIPAAAAVALPELDGIELTILGLHHSDGHTLLHVHASRLILDRRPLGAGSEFPPTLWIRDSGGRWHTTRASGWNESAYGGFATCLDLVPPLSRPPAWLEILVAGQSAEVRATLPLRWW